MDSLIIMIFTICIFQKGGEQNWEISETIYIITEVSERLYTIPSNLTA